MEQSPPAREFDADNACAPGIPPAGKPVELLRVAVMKFENGKTVHTFRERFTHPAVVPA